MIKDDRVVRDLGSALYNRAMCHIMNGDRKEALQLFCRCAREYGDVGAMMHVGGMLEAEGSLRRALVFFHDAFDAGNVYALDCIERVCERLGVVSMLSGLSLLPLGRCIHPPL